MSALPTTVYSVPCGVARPTLFRGNLLRTPRLRGLRATQAIRPF
jgi:hypothetical protein